jgi:hypothetical protein
MPRRILLALGVPALIACTRSSPHVDRGLMLDHGAPVKVFNPAGTIHLIAWDRDSVRISGELGRGEQLFWLGDARGIKLGVLQGTVGRPVSASSFTVYVPRTSSVAVKGARTDIDATGISGFLYTVSGRIALRGASREAEVESVSGAIDVDARVAWLRVHTASGTVSLTGSATDASVSTVSGNVGVNLDWPSRLHVESMSGAVVLGPRIGRGALVDLDTHDGGITFSTDSATAATVEIERAFPRAVRQPANRVGTQESPAQVRISTFSGVIRVAPVRPQ